MVGMRIGAVVLGIGWMLASASFAQPGQINPSTVQPAKGAHVITAPITSTCSTTRLSCQVACGPEKPPMTQEQCIASMCANLPIVQAATCRAAATDKCKNGGPGDVYRSICIGACMAEKAPTCPR